MPNGRLSETMGMAEENESLNDSQLAKTFVLTSETVVDETLTVSES